MGDLLEEGPPWLEGAWTPGWSVALARLVELSPAYLLPSHGGLQRDGSLLEWQAAFLAALVDGAERAHGGWTAADAVERSELEGFRERFASVGVEGESLDRYLVGAMEEALADTARQVPPVPPSAPDRPSPSASDRPSPSAPVPPSPE